MLGAIAGDIIGSIYEINNIKTKEFELLNEDCFFTDDTVLTVALADAILNDRDYGEVMREYYHEYPNAGYGGTFHQWAFNTEMGPYNSWGNGSAMRTSPVGFAFDDLDAVIAMAEHFASFTHNHPEGIKGAQSVSSAIFLARNGASRDDIKKVIVDKFDYDLSFTLDEIRPVYSFDVSCQGTVPQAIVSFLESENYEDAVRNAISLGGDSDTLACITGSIAEAYYGEVPQHISRKALAILDDRLTSVLNRFYEKFI